MRICQLLFKIGSMHFKNGCLFDYKITAGLICIVVAVIFAIAAFETIGLVIIVLPILLGVIAGIFAVTGIALLINGIKEMNKKS